MAYLGQILAVQKEHKAICSYQYKMSKEVAAKRHTCEVCGYETRYSSHMKTHLQRGDPCALTTDPTFKKMYDKYVIKQPKIDYSNIQCTQCNKTYHSQSSYSRHKGRCKPVQTQQPTILVSADEFEQLKRDVEELKKKQGSQNVINSNNNNCNNININVFGEESLSHLSTEILDMCVRRRNKGHVELIQQIHRPQENQNVKPSRTPNRFLCFNGETFETRMNHDVYDQMISQSYGLMVKHMDENEERMRKIISPTWLTDIYEYLDKVEANDFNTLIDLRTRLDKAFSKISQPP